MSTPDSSHRDAAEDEAHALEEVSPARGDIDLGDRNGVVSGDILEGGVIRGNGDLLIQGSVNGADGNLCGIDVEGRVTVQGAVAFARIDGREIDLRSDVTDSRIRSDLGATLGADITRSTVSLGNRRKELLTLRDYARELSQLLKQVEELRVRVASGARRFVRAYPEVNLKMGDVFVRTPRELVVDLSPFYKAVKGNSPEKIDRALEEFYLKVAVGVLTRNNREYIRRNPNRHKVFLKLIEELRKHVVTVRFCDRQAARVGELEILMSMIVDETTKGESTVLMVEGVLSGEIAVQVLHFQLDQECRDGFELDRSTAEARWAEGESGEILKTVDLDGKTGVLTHSDGVFQRGSLFLSNGRFTWKSRESNST
jgi:hypothetical protein